MKSQLLITLMVAMLGWIVPASALQVTPVDENLVSVTTASTGSDHASAVQDAKEKAVLACAGRVLLDDNLIRADDLLSKYLKTYANNFVKSVELTKDTYSAGTSVLEARVYVDYGKLVGDMMEKRFLYHPAYQPMFATFIDEKLDGRMVEQQPAKRLIQNAMTALGARFYTEPMEEAKSAVNLLDDPLLMKAAVVATERHNVELIVTGTASTNLREEKNLYYDHYYFYDCDMTISLVRVDTGEVLKTSTAKGSASNKDRSIAITGAIDQAAKAAGKELSATYKKFWPAVVQSKSDYEVLLTGVDDAQLGIVQKYLTTLSPGAAIDVKKKFDSSAVLSIRTSANSAQLVDALKSCSYPVLVIVNQKGKDKFEVQVSG